MKKLLISIVTIFAISFFALAEMTIYVYKKDGTKVPYVAADIDSIGFVEVEEDNYVAKPFSITETKLVIFSAGNLQYHAVNDEWRFAPKQTDYIGEDNSNVSSTYNGWIDLFGWGTGNNPTNSSTDYNDYSTFVDWGVNKIGNEDPNTWRTLTEDEWYFLLYNRTNASKLKGIAQVNGVNGLILLPNEWENPSDIIFKSGFNESAGIEFYSDYQMFNKKEWAILEESGAIFLPAAGRKSPLEGVVYIGGVQHYYAYMSASLAPTDEGQFQYQNISGTSSGVYMTSPTTEQGCSVRLVLDVE